MEVNVIAPAIEVLAFIGFVNLTDSFCSVESAFDTVAGGQERQA